MVSEGDTSSGKRLAASGAALLAVGLAIVSPGLKDAAVAFLNRVLGLGLSLNAPIWLGVVLIILGVVLLLIAFFGRDAVLSGLTDISGRGQATQGTLLVIKHTGFKSVVRDLRVDELPKAQQRRDLQHLRLDVSDQLSSSPPKLTQALAAHGTLLQSVEAIRSTNARAELAYCGIVQAPFQLLAGQRLTAWAEVLTFEWDRMSQRWIALSSQDGPDLGVHVREEQIGGGSDVAIAIEVSYPISTADISASTVSCGRIFRLAVAAPALDCVTSEGQVKAISKLFRQTLDSLHNEASPPPLIHVFCAAPMSVGFDLGRLISPTIHPPVACYAYNSQSTPRYKWGVILNTANGKPRIVQN